MASSSSTNSPCAACKFLRRKCTAGCVFAPYFPPDQPAKFASVHRVFGASNVAKLLNELSSEQREDAVNSLAYEAEARLRDPVYGCVGYISVLQHRLKQLQEDLLNAKKELSSYIRPTTASNPFLTATTAAAQQSFPPTNRGHLFNYHHHHSLPVLQHGMHSSAAAAEMGFGSPDSGASPSAITLREQQCHRLQIVEAQRLTREPNNDMLRHDLLRYAGGGMGGRDGDGGLGGFNHPRGIISTAGPSSGMAQPPRPLANPFHKMQHQQQEEHQSQRRFPDDGERRSDGGAGPGLDS